MCAVGGFGAHVGRSTFVRGKRSLSAMASQCFSLSYIRRRKRSPPPFFFFAGGDSRLFAVFSSAEGADEFSPPSESENLLKWSQTLSAQALIKWGSGRGAGVSPVTRTSGATLISCTIFGRRRMPQKSFPKPRGVRTKKKLIFLLFVSVSKVRSRQKGGAMDENSISETQTATATRQTGQREIDVRCCYAC